MAAAAKTRPVVLRQPEAARECTRTSRQPGHPAPWHAVVRHWSRHPQWLVLAGLCLKNMMQAAMNTSNTADAA